MVQAHPRERRVGRLAGVPGGEVGEAVAQVARQVEGVCAIVGPILGQPPFAVGFGERA